MKLKIMPPILGEFFELISESIDVAEQAEVVLLPFLPKDGKLQHCVVYTTHLKLAAYLVNYSMPNDYVGRPTEPQWFCYNLDSDQMTTLLKLATHEIGEALEVLQH